MIAVETLNLLLGYGTLVLQIVAFFFFALFLVRSRIPDLEEVAAFLEKWGLWIAFVLALGGTAMSLFYSEVLGFAPCTWCWWQRVFLYPQVILFGLAAIKNDRRIADYSIGLSVAGSIVALYQHYLQMGGSSIVPCPATLAQATDCAERFFFQFGYITFPLMCFSLFVFLIVLMLFVRKSE